MLCPVKAAELCTALPTPSVFLWGVTGQQTRGSVQDRVSHWGVLTNVTLWALWAFYALERSVCCLWLTKESQLSVEDPWPGILWGPLKNAASRQESTDCSLKAMYTTR